MRCPTLAELPPPPTDRTGWPWTEASPQLPNTMPDGTPWPRVSIVTPSYNQSKFIEETIRSVLLQGYPNLEYMVIDGGSTDDSVDIIEKYEPWLTYWVSEPDRGQSHAINKGWIRTNGDILAWLNSDDLYTPGAIHTAVQALHASPASDMVYSDLLHIDEHGDYQHTFVSQPFDPQALLDGSTYIPQQTTFIRRQSLSEVGWVDEQLHMLMDLDLWLRIGLRQKSHLVYLPGVTLAAWRKHPVAKTSVQSHGYARERLPILDKLFAMEGLPDDFASKRSTIYGRVYLWNAVVEAAQRRPSSIVKYLLKTLFTSPSIVARRPLGTLYLLKQAVFGLFQGRDE